MNEIDREDERLERLIAAVHAEADPAVLSRARARIAAAAAEVTLPLAWLGTPRGLATACALLLVSAGISFAVLNTESSSSRETTLMAALIGDDGSYGLPTESANTVDLGVVDSGEVSQ